MRHWRPAQSHKNDHNIIFVSTPSQMVSNGKKSIKYLQIFSETRSQIPFHAKPQNSRLRVCTRRKSVTKFLRACMSKTFVLSIWLHYLSPVSWLMCLSARFSDLSILYSSSLILSLIYTIQFAHTQPVRIYERTQKKLHPHETPKP